MSRKKSYKSLDDYIFKFMRYHSFRVDQHTYDGQYQRVSQSEFAKTLAEELQAEYLAPHPDTGKTGSVVPRTATIITNAKERGLLE